MGDGLFAECDFLGDFSDDAAEEDSGRGVDSGGHFKPCGAVGEHLGGSHFAPLPWAFRGEALDAVADFCDGCGLVEVAHGGFSFELPR